MSVKCEKGQLRLGTLFQSLNGQRQGAVGDMLGQGGQGAVYKVEFASENYALKWYHDHYIEVDQALKERLRRTITRGAPDHRFLWPLELVQMPGQNSFGYVMPIRPSEFRCIRDLLAPPPNKIVLPLEKRFHICWQIADSFLSLHADGFCYQDINFGNFFIHPNSADVMICDNDNVNIDGSDASIYGTRKFMAPEVVLKQTLPNTQTDLFSMAVLFFYVLFGWHPLDGKREAEARVLSPDLETELYGHNPAFIFDPAATENGPVTPLHEPIVCRWQSLPQILKDLFQHSFSIGLKAPNERVAERQWMKAFEQIGRATFECTSCRYEHVLVPISAPAPDPLNCVYCDQPLTPPPLLQIGSTGFALAADKAISQRDIGVLQAAAWDSAALVVTHPSRKDVLGLRNMMDQPWVVQSEHSDPSLVAPGKTVMLIDGLTIDFGPRKGLVHYSRKDHPRTLKEGLADGKDQAND